MNKKRLVIIFIAITTLLMIPLVAMQFTEEVNWSAGDFFIAVLLLGSTGLLMEMVMQKFHTKTFRILGVLAVLLLAFLVWVELAVGWVGSPIAGN